MNILLKTARAAAILITSAVAALAVAGNANADTVKIGVAAEAYPPFTVPDASGNWSGWEIDFMHAVCKDQQMDCKIVPVAWDGIIPALTSGQIDAIVASMGITPERRKIISFSDKYYTSSTVVVAPKNIKVDPEPKSLAGKVIGVQVATIYERYAQKHLRDSTIKTYQSQDEVNQDLISGRIDAVLADGIALQAFLDSNAGACCEIKGEVKRDTDIMPGAGVGIGLRKGEDALKTKFNKGIANIRANGTYDAITKKYFDFDVYTD
ncbi:MAG: transporter substrate-binding domain-containing protein [Mesorhizobium sp.]|uniref:transporter substrate-binding domain-containing protein n=1 Tax=Mesorhizobium sp. TaxID=1871066 RepID=UPI000FE47D42|nr:transporter substrate-binding domain-containing protein [Mesorhizobium sp.]RWB39730.1 MAG: transporter substrate-binding domain-containing protein [Mesorhizobium sp.]